MTDAIARTLARLLLTPAAAARMGAGPPDAAAPDLTLAGFYRRMAPSRRPRRGLRRCSWRSSSPGACPVALPLLAAWLFSPAVARWISLPPSTRRGAAGTDGRAVPAPRSPAAPGDTSRPSPARRKTRSRPTTSRRHRSPSSRTARRRPTSASFCSRPSRPTTSAGSGPREMLDRLEATLASVGRLERHRGHLSTGTTRATSDALEPRYVSTVDSGNLAGHLIALKQACIQKLSDPPSFGSALDGVRDALGLLRESATGLVAGSGEGAVTRRQIQDLWMRSRPVSRATSSAAEWTARFSRLHAEAGNRGRHDEGACSGRGARPRRGGARLGRTPSGTLSRATGGTSRRRSAGRVGCPDALRRRAISRRASSTCWRGSPARTPPWIPSRTFTSPPPRRSRDSRRRAASGTGAALVAADLRSARAAAAAIARRLASVAHLASELVEQMDFTFLFDSERQLFSIGYRLTDGAARLGLLRSPGVGGAPGELRRDRARRRARRPLVPPRPLADARRQADRRWSPGRARCSST